MLSQTENKSEMNELPTYIRGTLNYVLHEAFHPECSNVKITQVYIIGKQLFEEKLKSDQSGKIITSGIWYQYHDETLYALNYTITPKSKYGPFDMLEIFYTLKRAHVRTPIQCLDLLHEFRIEHLPQGGWILESGKNPIQDNFPPIFIRDELNFAFTNYALEMPECQGVIVVPGAISREYTCSSNHKIDIVERNHLYIIKIEISENQWFIIQSSRAAFYENYNKCFLAHKTVMNY